MDKQRAREWLKQQVETAVELSGKPPKIAVWGVVLQLPGDIVATLASEGVTYGFAGHFWFDYLQGETTVCVPIKINE